MASDRQNPRLFMIPKPNTSNEQGQILGLECMQIVLITGAKTLVTFSPNASRGVNELFVDGHACVSHGPLVLIVGGYSDSAIGGIHIFNTATGQWTPGSNFQFPRGSFAWGVIGNHLYIAGVIGPSGTVNETEVYDLETEELWAVAALPVFMAVNVFFLFSGKLRVRGWVRGHSRGFVEWTSKCLCYCPHTNAWQNDSWLQNVLNGVPRRNRLKFAAISDEVLYKAELQKLGEGLNRADMKKLGEALNRPNLEKLREGLDRPNPGPWSVFIYKLDQRNFLREKFFLTIDSEVGDRCKWPAGEREVRFFAFRERLLVLTHCYRTDKGEVTPLADDITAVSFLCPSRWASAAILYAQNLHPQVI